MVRAAGVDPDRLTLELTEQAMLSDPASAAAQLAQIRSLGCAIAIDDFGTGYSSLSLLARLPIDYLKIDSGFTRSEEHTSELQSLMRISYAVFCLKTKNKQIARTQTQTHRQYTDT